MTKEQLITVQSMLNRGTKQMAEMLRIHHQTLMGWRSGRQKIPDNIGVSLYGAVAIQKAQLEIVDNYLNEINASSQLLDLEPLDEN